MNTLRAVYVTLRFSLAKSTYREANDARKYAVDEDAERYSEPERSDHR